MGLLLGKVRVGNRKFIEPQGSALRQDATLYLMGVPACGAALLLAKGSSAEGSIVGSLLSRVREYTQ